MSAFGGKADIPALSMARLTKPSRFILEVDIRECCGRTAQRNHNAAARISMAAANAMIQKMIQKKSACWCESVMVTAPRIIFHATRRRYAHATTWARFRKPTVESRE